LPPVRFRRVGLLGIGAFLLLVIACVHASPASDAAEKPDTSIKPSQPATDSHTVPSYSIQAGLDGEIFPVFANYASLQKPQERRWATVSVKIRNSSDKPARNRITVEIPGWSDQEIQISEVPAGDVRTYQFAPSFLPRLYRNREITAATAVVRVNGMGGEELYRATVPVRLRSAQDMYWGPDFEYAQFIAAWVTPHDARVEGVLSRAKEFMPGRRLPGYEEGENEVRQEQSTIAQVRAIYRALKEQGVSYVKSSFTFGANEEWSERVRPPRESLRQNSANCIDGALMYASLFENLGMEPVVVLVPGHAYVGVRLAQGSDRFLYLETSYTGRASFEAATNTAKRNLARYRASDRIVVRIEQARQAGIYPMPE
jgi:hypothetical protein